MASDNLWIEFVELAPKPKTKVWMVRTTDELHLVIGTVKWYGPWRKYCFFPAPDSVFEQDCLGHIASFIVERTKEHVKR